MQNIDIEKLIPYENNPRDNDDAVAKVMASIKEFGFQQPIVVDKDFVIIAGHTRHKAAKKLKLKIVPVIVADKLTPEQVRAYRLADNRTNENAQWINEMLALEMQALMDDGYDMALTGFDEDEIAKLLAAGGTEGGTKITVDEELQLPESDKKELLIMLRILVNRIGKIPLKYLKDKSLKNYKDPLISDLFEAYEDALYILEKSLA